MKTTLQFLFRINFLLFCAISVNAQSNLQTILNQHKPYLEIVADAQNYFNCPNEDSLVLSIWHQDKDYTRFKRWQSENEHRVLPNGFIASPMIDYLEFQKIKKTRSGVWKAVGQNLISQTPGGIGRVDAVGFHPSDSNIMYLGTWAGGVFKTIDGGQNWVSVGDDLPYASVGSVCVDAINPNIVFITVGQGIINGSGIGVFKSTDAGATWAQTAHVSTEIDAITYHQLIMHPTNTSIMFSCQSNGLFKTIDGGNTWTQINNLDVLNLHFNLINPNTIYFVGTGFNSTPAQIFKSFDGGVSFAQVSNLPSALFISMGLTVADTNFIGVRYVNVSGGSTPQYQTSTNGGSIFTMQNSNNTLDNGGRTVVSQLNKNRLYTGFPYLYKSINAGVNFTVSFSIHADTRGIYLSPFNKRYIYLCTDGGLYRLDDSTGTTVSLSEGLNITHFYNVAVSERDTVKLLGGALDNGSRYKNVNSFWKHVSGGDGFACAINPIDTGIMYSTSQNGTIYRTLNSWNTFVGITPAGQVGTFSTQLNLNPQNPSSLYTIYHDVYKATDNGNTWTSISNFTSFSATSKLRYLAVAPQDSNVIYVGNTNFDKYFFTNNEGATWNPFTPPITFGGSYLSNIAIHPQDISKILITKDGYYDKDKFYLSSDKGMTWKNLSYNLPNVPLLCMVLDNGVDTNNITYYVGTTIGVYYMHEKDTVWQYFGTGLPRSNINELVIRKLDRKLVACTGGRGIYEIKLPENNFPEKISVVEKPLFTFNNPANGMLYLNNVSLDLTAIKIFDFSGRLVFDQKLNTNSSAYKFDINLLKNGLYVLQLSNSFKKQQQKLLVVK
jgi:photosystem II stability/assembly factor-like uncharacterized protein